MAFTKNQFLLYSGGSFDILFTHTLMPNPRLTQIIAELPFEKKIVGGGALLMLIGLFFPWYQDLDSFRTGDTFSGLSGPMYLVGFSFLLIASFSILVLVMDYLDKKVPLFKVKTAKLHFWSGIISFYLLFLVGSVYFHPAFGVNITLKQSGVGMFIAYASAALLTIGGYLEGRGKAAVKEFEKETREEMVAPEVERGRPMPRENLRSVSSMERAPYSGVRGSGMRHPSQDVRQPASLEKVEQPAMDLQTPVAQEPEVVAAASQSGESDDKEPKSQPYRMDL